MHIDQFIIHKTEQVNANRLEWGYAAKSYIE